MEVSRSPQSRHRTVGYPFWPELKPLGPLGPNKEKKIMLMGKKEQQEQSSYCKSLHERRASYP